ncbi:hypothetical protein [Ferrimonas marina]|uniref:Uncharacterized protein n=1 Tax=Ferrimonas marina TaxID=299255 RepID=A0A1M5XY97_9GAMM|nr:hypothetical protein [Ferrimonas marina]SHI04223.1 hypothetical protein SAMN02745129_3764 [Ferrimonas marina]
MTRWVTLGTLTLSVSLVAGTAMATDFGSEQQFGGPASGVAAAQAQQLEALEARFAALMAEPRDEAWAYDMELAIADELALHEHKDKVTLESVYCYSTGCIATVFSEFAPSGMPYYSEVQGSLIERGGEPPFTEIHGVMDPDSMTLEPHGARFMTYFLQRR